LVLTTLAGLAATGLAPSGAWRRMYFTASIALAGITFVTLGFWLQLNRWEKFEIFSVAIGLVLITASYIGRFRETADARDDLVTLGLGLGSILVTIPLLVAVAYWRFSDEGWSQYNELALFIAGVLMVLTGFSWQVKSTTFFGGTALFLWLVMILVALGWHQPQKMVGVYLAIGGALVFGIGIGLSVYRERLMQLPERIAKREGVFRMLNWR
jgi:hypothetical protein